MAGEIEEPFRFNFQADLLHSGSISFGRFESESLSWERRSSFSHNRYLEDVEKYSKPGSVTEMKAYFEAHFRRKALLKKSSSESQEGREFQTIENDDSENGNDSKHFTCFDESPRSSGQSKYGEETEIQSCVKENVKTLCFENGNASSQATNFNESPCCLSYEGGEVLECERDDLEVFSAGPNNASMMHTVDHMVSGAEHLDLKETHLVGNENVVLVKSEVNIRENVNDKNDDSRNSASQRSLSSKVRPASETKQPKPKLKAHTNYAQVQKNISTEASSGSGKGKTRESKGLLIKEKEKKSPRPASPIPHSGRRTSKLEESSMSFPKAKTIPLNTSIVKEFRSEKTMEAKSLPGARQSVNRTKHTVIPPSKPHVNQSAAGFTSKSDQRAERKKEVKRAAEMTQCRKSANFKATPMPSFYKESSRCSDQNKVIPTNKTQSRPQTASMAPHTNKYLSNSTASLNPRPGSSTSLTNRNRPSEAPRRVQEKKKDSSSQKQKESEPTKAPQARDTLRRSGPRVGYLAVSP